MKNYDIAAYVWPAYTGKEPRSRIFWPDGIGEWQTVKDSRPKDNGYFWNRKPLWDYIDEADPEVMEMQIDAATEHGVNVFIYDWYWYDRRPFLEQCLNNGFLKAKNREKMKFYIMWANHDANYLWDKRNAGIINETIWKAQVDFNEFKIIGQRWIDQYFTKENYYKIDNKPVVSIYDLPNFIIGLGGIEGAKQAMKWLDDETKSAGLEGVHFQFVRWDNMGQAAMGINGKTLEFNAKMIEDMGFLSLTHYQFIHFTDMKRDYLDIIPDVQKEWAKIENEFNIPYCPHVSIGWDNNPRHTFFKPKITRNNTPENFEKALRLAKDLADKQGVNLITINSWNEWTETSYLEPDNVNGYGYLEAIKRVFKNTL